MARPKRRQVRNWSRDKATLPKSPKAIRREGERMRAFRKSPTYVRWILSHGTGERWQTPARQIKADRERRAAQRKRVLAR